MRNVRTRSSQAKGSLGATEQDVWGHQRQLPQRPPFFMFFYRYFNPRVNKFRKTLVTTHPHKTTVQSPRTVLFMSATNRHNSQRAPKARKEQILSKCEKPAKRLGYGNLIDREQCEEVIKRLGERTGLTWTPSRNGKEAAQLRAAGDLQSWSRWKDFIRGCAVSNDKGDLPQCKLSSACSVSSTSLSKP